MAKKKKPPKAAGAATGAGQAKAEPQKKKKKRGKKDKAAAHAPPPAPARPRQKAESGVPPKDAFSTLRRLGPPAHMQPQDAPRQPVQPKAAGEEGGGKKTQTGAGKKGKRPARAPKAANPQKRRRRRRLTAVFAVLVLVGAGIWFSFAVLFKIQSFEIRGDIRYSLEEVQAEFGPSPGDNMYGFSATAAAKRITEALPYIEEIRIRRSLPSTIRFEVVEAVESYSVPWNGEYLVLSQSMRVLRSAADEPPGLLRIGGLSCLKVTFGQALEIDPEALATAQSAASEAARAASSSSQPQSLSPESGGLLFPHLALPQSQTSSSAPESNSLPESWPEGESGPLESSQSEEPTSEAVYTVSGARADESLALVPQLLEALAATGLTDITWIDVGDPINILFRWEDRITVRLGPKSGLETKLATAVVILTDTNQGLLKPGDAGVLDMTYYLATGRSYFQAD